MKKLFSFLSLVTLLFAFGAFDVFAELGPYGRSTVEDVDGSPKAGTEEKYYISVKNVSGAEQAAGTVMAYDATEADGFSVSKSVSETAPVACVLTESCASGAVCKACQVHGMASVKFSAGGGSIAPLDLAVVSVWDSGYTSKDSSLVAGQTVIGTYFSTHTVSSETASVFLKIR